MKDIPEMLVSFTFYLCLEADEIIPKDFLQKNQHTGHMPALAINLHNL